MFYDKNIFSLEVALKKKLCYLIHGLSDINGRLVGMQEICRFIGAFQYVIHNKFYYVLYFLCTCTQ